MKMYRGSTALDIDYLESQKNIEKKLPGRHRPAAGRRNRARSLERVLFLLSVSFVFAFVALLVVQVGICADISRIEKERSRLESKIILEKQRTQELKVEFACLLNPERIRLIAEKDLGMHEATEVVFIQLRKVEGAERSKVVSRTTPISLVSHAEPEMR